MKTSMFIDFTYGKETLQVLEDSFYGKIMIDEVDDLRKVTPADYFWCVEKIADNSSLSEGVDILREAVLIAAYLFNKQSGRIKR